MNVLNLYAVSVDTKTETKLQVKFLKGKRIQCFTLPSAMNNKMAVMYTVSSYMEKYICVAVF